MPYKMVKRRNKWYVYNRKTGKLKGTHTTREKAEAQIRLLEGIEHGWKPTHIKK